MGIRPSGYYWVSRKGGNPQIFEWDDEFQYWQIYDTSEDDNPDIKVITGPLPVPSTGEEG